MNEIKERLLEAAAGRGQSVTRPVMVALNNNKTNYNDIRFVVSHAEPHDVSTPLNVLWIVQDSNSPDYGKVLRRSSRSSSGGYTHSWSEVTSEQSLYVAQIWDMPEPAHQTLYDHVALIGNPHAMRLSDLEGVSKKGDKLSGKLLTRTLEQGEQYDMAEVTPRSFLETSLTPLRSITSSLQMFFSNLNNQLTSVRNRTTAVEGRATALETRVTKIEEDGTGGGIASGFSYAQEEPAEVWQIGHNLDSTDVLIQVFEGTEVVWPAETVIVDENNVKIVFAIPVAGKAKILPIS